MRAAIYAPDDKALRLAIFVHALVRIVRHLERVRCNHVFGKLSTRVPLSNLQGDATAVSGVTIAMTSVVLGVSPDVYHTRQGERHHERLVYSSVHQPRCDVTSKCLPQDCTSGTA